MGHRLSKSNTTPSLSSQPPNTQSSTTTESSSTSLSSNITAASTTINQRQANDKNSISLNVQDIINNPAATTSHITSIDVTTSNTTTTTIAAGNSSDNQNFHIESTTVTVPAQAAARRFIIKIQLTKMEPGSSPDDPTTMTTMTTSVALDGNDNGNHASDNLDNNLNVTRPILNLTFMKNIECDSSNEIVIESNEEIKLNNLNAISEHRNSGTSISSNFVNNFATAPFIDEDGNEMMINRNSSPPHGIWSRRLSGSNRSSPCSEDSHDVPEINQKMPECSLVGASSTMCGEGDKNHCCRRKKSSSYPSKWRCCKCVCRTCRTSPTHSKESTPTRDESNSNSSTPSPSSNNPNNINNTNNNNNNNNNRTAKSNNCAKQDITVHSSDLAMWVPPENILQNPETGQLHRVLPHFNISPELVLVTLNYPQSILMGPVEDCDERARRLRAIEIETGVDPTSAEFGSPFANMLSSQKHWPHFMCSPTSGFGPVVHSQVDYIHCLVPDLDKITNSSFYWGKMDRYEAERLLEGKPEGTFLLRDSAQEEYLFSVTFRKYGRSLHARIEQFNHKFSFDCHDPGVFTATTVTGLLEHYKDPSCVMFFEPMLTIPLHRNFTFSLQQLCRATIASNITYDGVNELQLPNSLKSYLKEYYYKLRVRVKPFDEPFYSCS